MASKSPPLIAHIIYALGTGGLENGLVNIINRASPERYQHVIICLTRAEGFERRITAPNIEVIALEMKPGHDFGVYWRLWLTLLKLRPAIVHTRNLAALEMQAIAFMLPGTKRVHGEHGRDIQDLDGLNKKYNRLRKVMRLFVHRYIAVSQDLATWLRNIVNVSPEKITQIYNGVDQEKFQPGVTDQVLLVPDGFLPDKAFVIGTVGRLAEVKDQLTLVKAFTLLLERKPELKKQLRLLLVGDGSMHEVIQDEVIAQDLVEQVWMPGDRDDIPDLLAMMDIFVLPSLAEGVSNTILEAMASGLAIIATRVGGNLELVEDGENGHLVTPSDPAALADAIDTMFNNPQQLRLAGELSLRRVKESFDWDRAVEEYLAVYDQLLGVRKSITGRRIQPTAGSS